MNGDWPLPLPMVLGHEAAGIVEEVAPGVTNVKPGDHVIFSFRPHCGRCLYCSIGRSILCDGHNDTPRWVLFDGTHRLKRGGDEIKQMARIGTFAEQVVCPAEQLVPIRKEMPWPQAALLGCCVPTGVGAVTRCAEVEPGASVMIVGCGGVGLNVVQGARLAGAGVIVAVDLLDNKLEFARTFGATHTVNASKTNAVEFVRGLTGGRGVDYAFDAIGGEATTLQILDAIRPGGTAVIAVVGEMGRELSARRPDALVIVADDHLNVFSFDAVPAMCVRIGRSVSRMSQEGAIEFDRALDGLAERYPVHEDLANRILEDGLEAGFDFAASWSAPLDHAFLSPLTALYGARPMPPLVPFWVNCFVAPLPPARRCFAAGQPIARVLAEGPWNVSMIATGGLTPL